MKHSAISLFLGIGLVGCYSDALLLEGKLDGDGSSGVSTGGTSSVPSSTGAFGGALGGRTQVHSTVAPTHKYEACAAPYANIVTVRTLEELTTLMTGDWYQCETKSAFCTTDEVGLRINADGTWTKLIADAFGNVSEASASATLADGTWVADFSGPLGPTNHLGFHTSGGGGYIASSQIAEGGQVMFLDNTACSATYIKATGLDYAGIAHDLLNGVPVVPNTVVPAVDSAKLAQCDANQNSIDISSLASMQQSVNGVWMLCPSSPTGCADGEAGILFESDGNWSKLYADEGGALHIGLGSGRRGYYRLSPDDGYGIGRLVGETFGAPRGPFVLTFSASGASRFDSSRLSACAGFYQKIEP